MISGVSGASKPLANKPPRGKRVLIAAPYLQNTDLKPECYMDSDGSCSMATPGRVDHQALGRSEDTG